MHPVSTSKLTELVEKKGTKNFKTLSLHVLLAAKKPKSVGWVSKFIWKTLKLTYKFVARDSLGNQRAIAGCV